MKAWNKKACAVMAAAALTLNGMAIPTGSLSGGPGQGEAGIFPVALMAMPMRVMAENFLEITEFGPVMDMNKAQNGAEGQSAALSGDNVGNGSAETGSSEWGSNANAGSSSGENNSDTANSQGDSNANAANTQGDSAANVANTQGDSAANTGNASNGTSADSGNAVAQANAFQSQGPGIAGLVSAVLEAGSAYGPSGASTDTGSSEQSSFHSDNSVNLAFLPKDAETKSLDGLIESRYAILYDLDESRIVAEKNSEEVIYPASMTKIMTALVLAETLSGRLTELQTITQDIVDYIYAHDASNCGFDVGEQVSIYDLLYGVVLPSGADAVMAACRAAAGSDQAFVDLMNQKARDLGLSENANFCNATGLYDANHHLTVKDMAQILRAAMENDLARTVLSAHTYQTQPTNKHSNGKSFSNLFLRRIEDQNTNGTTVVAAKTGYVRQSMFCAASYAISQSGKHYIVVTGYAPSTWQCIYDQAAIYRTYT